MSDEFDLTIKHSDYEKNEALRTLSRVLYEGRIGQVRELLVRNEYEQHHFFQSRQQTVVYENLLKPIIAARVGLLTRKTIDFNVPEVIEQYLSNIDGQGSNINAFTRDIITDADVDGISWAIVDVPNSNSLKDENGNPLIRTRQDELEANIRPFVKKIPAANVIRWRENPVDHKLDFAVIRSDQITGDEIGSKTEIIERYVVWTRKAVQVYERNKNRQNFNMIDEAANQLGEIPIVPFYGIRDQYRFSGIPFGHTILQHLVKILNVESQKHYGLDLITMPRMYIIAEDQPTEVPTVDNAFFLPIGRQTGVKPDLGYVEPSGKGIELASQEINELIHRVFRNTMYLSKKPTGQVQSAESQRQETTILKADLSSVALNHETSLKEVFRLINAWENIGSTKPDSDEINVKFTRDFDVQRLTPQEIKELVNLSLNGMLSKQTLWEQLVSGEVLNDSFSTEDELVKLSEEMDVTEKNVSF
jgi:hypothetical protein